MKSNHHLLCGSVWGFAGAGLLVVMTSCSRGREAGDMLPCQNPEKPIEERVTDLVSRMTLEEKVSQMMNSASAIERLGVPEYNWWNTAAEIIPASVRPASNWKRANLTG